MSARVRGGTWAKRRAEEPAMLMASSRLTDAECVRLRRVVESGLVTMGCSGPPRVHEISGLTHPNHPVVCRATMLAQIDVIDKVESDYAATVLRRAEALGWSMSELARRIKVTPGHFSRVVAGQRPSARAWREAERVLTREERARIRRRPAG